MNLSMALRAESDQILFGIVPRLAAKLSVVNLKIVHGAARLASPAVAVEHLVAKLVVGVGIQSQTGILHEFFSVA